LYFDRPTNTGGDGWDIGGRVDLNYGTNARFDTEAGLENKINSPNHPYMNLALQQFYGEAAYNNLKVKFGHFLSPVGYFVVPTPQNFFNSLPYTFQYGEPFTHTGMLANWTPSEHWTFGAGFARGWDNFGNANPHLCSITTATWTGNNNDSFAWVWIQSHEPDANSGGVDPPPGGRVYSSRYLHTLVYSRPLSEKVTWVAQSDLGVQGAAFGPGTRTARWYGLNQYLFYKVNDAWTWGIQYEWFRDEEGFRVGGLFPSVFNPNASGNAVGTGFAGNFSDINFGPQWRPNGSQNLLIRPNLRWDWYGGSTNGAGQLPYDNGTKAQQFIWGTDVVILY
jgi:Putative beta-barrel porin-2, OmpL-like. bbp2